MTDRLDETAVLPATSAGITAAIEAFGEFSRAAGLPDDERRRFQLALDEVLSNVVRHGLAGRPGTLNLTFSRAQGLVSVQVKDDAPAFDPRTAPVPDVAAPLEARKVGGLGIALVAALMDDVHYERVDGWNCLVMTRRVADEL